MPVASPRSKFDITRVFIATDQKIDLLDLEDEFILVAELLELPAADHLADLVFALAELLTNFLHGVEHLVHWGISKSCLRAETPVSRLIEPVKVVNSAGSGKAGPVWLFPHRIRG